ncbi:HXXEE domain-containing protein [Bombilactobacillus thymidiniphilus]|uniref:HXXEE domain-containing protein n=1 Tax=Bombilactobacillus thymidiniphilus TaxID=2923363 RepID=A0ABY4PBQ8_9LACO|nr:HXXEE domain-containing protein [Bombilactobacillus thymidiniphilus]UQS83117.1 HXXEE domain-containing protein [Bombilactobacillus thymidiniphilus]
MINTTPWYQWVWPWIGLGGAIVIIILLFCTNFLRRNLNITRWRDPAWLAWALTAAYLIHNTEEYGIDLTGALYNFPTTMSKMLNTGASVGGNPPADFFTAVNISMFWIASPIAAVLARKGHKVFAVGMAGEELLNAFSHIVPFFIGRGYNSGALSAIVIFLPLSLWTFYSCFGKGKLKYVTMWLVVGTGAFSHLFLMASIIMFTHGLIGSQILVLLQIINACLALFLWWLIENVDGKRFVQIKY